MTGTVLVVRHGDGRGRIDRYMEPALDTLRRRGSGVKVEVHNTGGGEVSLEGVVAIVFWLADPLKEWYPACYDEAVAIAERARAQAIRLVNPPESLSNSIKSRQSKLWLAAGFDTARWTRFDDGDQMWEVVDEIGYPAVIRADEAHSRRGMRVIGGAADLRAVPVSDVWLPGCAAPLLNVRHRNRQAGKPGAYCRLYHKKRIHVLGDRVRTEHLLFSRSPIVSAGRSTFQRYDRLPAMLHPVALLSRDMRDAVHEDLRHWQREVEHTDLMVQAAAALGLGFAAIDYSEREDGSTVLWEANPHPFWALRERVRLSKLRLGPERIASYHRAIGDFLIGLAA